MLDNRTKDFSDCIEKYIVDPIVVENKEEVVVNSKEIPILNSRCLKRQVRK